MAAAEWKRIYIILSWSLVPNIFGLFSCVLRCSSMNNCVMIRPFIVHKLQTILFLLCANAQICTKCVRNIVYFSNISELSSWHVYQPFFMYKPPDGFLFDYQQICPMCNVVQWLWSFRLYCFAALVFWETFSTMLWLCIGVFTWKY